MLTWLRQFFSDSGGSDGGGHANRNFWGQHQAPARMPDEAAPFLDPATGVLWTPPQPGEASLSDVMGWHQIDTDEDGVPDSAAQCWRGELPPDQVRILNADPDYRAAFDEVRNDALDAFQEAASLTAGLGPVVSMPMAVSLGALASVQPEDVTPGFQSCYDPQQGGVNDSGTFDFSTPNSPLGVAFHFALDVVPDLRDDNYVAYPQSNGMDVSGGGDAAANPGPD